MNAVSLNRAFKVLVFMTWTQRVVRCQYYAEEMGEIRGHLNEEQHEDHHTKPLYKFGYWVHDPKTKDVKNHWEHRDGDVVHGAYSFLQPDGHVRLVEYTADKHNGFNAHVKYMYQGSDGGGGGGGGGGGNDFGPDLNQHLEYASSQISNGGGVGGRDHHPKQHLLRKFYKKPRAEKPWGRPGRYDRKSYPFDDNRSKSRTGGERKTQRSPTAAAERHHNRPHFDAFSGFSSSVGGRLKFDDDSGGHSDNGNGRDAAADPPPTEHFSRKYSTLPTSAAPGTAAVRYPGDSGIQQQSSEHEPITVHRHRADDVASAERSAAGIDGLVPDDGEWQRHKQQRQQRSQPQQQQQPPPQQQYRRLRPLSYRLQRSHGDDGYGSANNGDDERTSKGDDERTSKGDDERTSKGDDERTSKGDGGNAGGGGSGDDNVDRTRQREQADDVDVQKQPLREFHYKEPPPYPFEVPENVRVSAGHRKRHTPRAVVVSPSPYYFPGLAAANDVLSVYPLLLE